MDKVVQDLTGEEGTGVWSNEEAVRLHIVAPTLTTAHYFRLASAYEGQRKHINKETGGGFKPQKLEVDDKKAFVELLRVAVYTTCLASYAQGINVIEAANQENKWSINYDAIWQIWRAGCIIQADYISDEILKPVFLNKDRKTVNLLYEQNVAKAFKDGYPKLKKVLAAAMEGDFIVPSLSATLEYIKYQSNTGEFFPFPISPIRQPLVRISIQLTIARPPCLLLRSRARLLWKAHVRREG